ncbi:Hsp20 family protein [uncultured Lamprocystis sp.]|uniref:Hsp20/alpha crystallin family protein n=1 Tax=uncultured Lamprocystis sp. TaxID=543132 RepID=UPI0025E55DB6|nr:Hsp20 family protein [uncultured Lamprocystis sp.]
MHIACRLYCSALVGMIAVAIPTVSLAWTCNGPPVYGPPGSVAPPFPVAAPGPFPWRAGAWAVPGTPTTGAPRQPPATALPPPHRVTMARGLRIARAATPEAYLVRIGVGNAKPDEVQINLAGRNLIITMHSDARTLQEDTMPDGRGYRRSYSVAQSSMSRRLALPPDADAARMTKRVVDGTILLSIPRRSAAGFQPGWR